MKMGRPITPLTVPIIALLSVANTLCVLALMSNRWISTTLDDGSTTVAGLWEECACKSTVDKTDWGRGVQITVSLGAGFLFVSFVAFLVYLACRNKAHAAIVIGASCFLGALFLGIGFLIHGLKETDLSRQKFDWAFWVSVSSAALAVCCSVFAFIDARRYGLQGLKYREAPQQ